MKFFYILLFFTQVSFYSLPFSLSFRGNFNQLKASSSSEDQDINDQESSNSIGSLTCGGCDCRTCNHTLPAPKKIINPYKEELSNYVPTKPFGNLCIRCVACLAVAHEMENVMRSSSQECETHPEKKKRLLKDITKKINNLCKTGFKNFNLRVYGDHKIVTNRVRCTKHIISTMDGNWTKKLRELCTLYVSKINVGDISMNVLDSMANLKDSMCRSTGIFRDCSNIKSHQHVPMPTCENC